jgi:small subunit ribosomal protein S11
MFSLRRSLSTSSQALLNAAHNHGAAQPVNLLSPRPANGDGPPAPSLNTQPVNPLFPRPANGDGPPVPGPQAYTPSQAGQMTWQNDSRMRSAYRFDCHSSRNNTITTLSSLTYDEKQKPFEPPCSRVIAWFSGGSLKFKKGQRAGYEAGYQCAIQVFKVLENLKKVHGSKVSVDLYFNGFGQGREALKTALMATEGSAIRDTIKNITDCTPLKIGGTRSSKTRRL